MKEVQINGVEYLLVSMPEDATNFRFGIQKNAKRLYGTSLSSITDINKEGLCWSGIVPEKVMLIGKASDLTEQDWQQIVERFNNGAFRDYRDKKLWSPDDGNIDFLLTAKESGYSLLELHEFNPERTLILKRKA